MKNSISIIGMILLLANSLYPNYMEAGGHSSCEDTQDCDPCELDISTQNSCNFKPDEPLDFDWGDNEQDDNISIPDSGGNFGDSCTSDSECGSEQGEKLKCSTGFGCGGTPGAKCCL